MKIKNCINIIDCIACANSYRVTGQLESLGYDVKRMGTPLTHYLKEGYKVLRF